MQHAARCAFKPSEHQSLPAVLHPPPPVLPAHPPTHPMCLPAELARQVARTADLYLLCHVSDDVGEAVVRGALEHAGLLGSQPGQVPPHRYSIPGCSCVDARKGSLCVLLLVLPQLPQLVLAACIAAGMICASPCCRGLAPSCPPPSLPSASLPDCLPPPAASPRNACLQGAVLRDSGGQSVSGAAAGAGASHRRTPADGEAAKLGQEGRLGRQPATGQARP